MRVPGDPHDDKGNSSMSSRIAELFTDPLDMIQGIRGEASFDVKERNVQ